MVIRLHNGMKSVQLAEKSPGPGSEQVVKEQFVIFMSALIKGNAEEKSSIIMKMISKAEGAVKGSQILEVKSAFGGEVFYGKGVIAAVGEAMGGIGGI